MDYEISGIAHGPKPLHTIARLSSLHLNALGPRLFDIPLIYGMYYDGCDIEYHFDNSGHVEIGRMSPTTFGGDARRSSKMPPWEGMTREDDRSSQAMPISRR